MLLSAWLFAPAAWAYDFEADGIYYNITSSGYKTVEVTTSPNYSYSDDVTIPKTVTNEESEYRVTAIGNFVFDHCSSLTSVTIPESVTAIGNGAFRYCNGLTSVTIPNSVTIIGDNAFEYCENLTSVTIGDGVTTIGGRAFYDCYELTSVTIPNSVTTIGDYAFWNCRGLTSITIPESVTAIGEAAFLRCENLISVTIGKNVQTIGEAAFYRCESLTSVTVYNPIPVNIDEKSVFSFVDYDNCTLYVPVESIALYKAAEGWKNFLNIKYKIDGIGYNILSSDERTAEVINGGYSGDIVIPETIEYEGITYRVTAIGNGAFSGCPGLTSVTIGDGVTAIDNETFYDCNGLTSVTIGNGVTTIGDKAFWLCESLTSVTIGKNVQIIGNDAFYHCNGLTSVTIPESVTAIGDWAFSGCHGLTSVTIPESVQTIGNGTFSGCSGLTEFRGKFASDYGRCLIVNDTLKAFAPSGLTQYTIPNEVKVIGDGVFEYCENLISVTIGKSVTTIGDGAFEYCENLTSVTIGKSVTTIGDGAFFDCSGLTSVTIPESVQTIGERAFYYCTGLTSVTAYNPTPVDIVITTEWGSTYFAFDDVDCANCKLYVPEGSVDAYKAAEGWSKFGTILPINESSAITEIRQDNADGHVTVYNLQGVPVLETDDAAALKTLQNGAYIVNGKKMIIAR